MERTQLINKVKTRIDEVCASGDIISPVGVENTKPYDSIIDELLNEAAIELLLKVPYYRLDVASANVVCSAIGPIMTQSEQAEGDGVKTIAPMIKNAGRAILPDDFLRLVSFKMSEWQQPVTELYFAHDEVAKRQANIYTRASVAKPVGVLRKLADGYAIDYYSVTAQTNEHTLEEFLYIKRDTPENISDELVDIMVWICAGKTLGVLGEAGLKDICFENAKGLML